MMRNDTSVGGTNCSAVTVTKRSKGQKDPILSPFLETSGPPPFILHPLHSDFDGKLFSQGSHKLSTNTSFLHDTKHSLHQENFNQGTPQTLSQLKEIEGKQLTKLLVEKSKPISKMRHVLKTLLEMDDQLLIPGVHRTMTSIAIH